MKRWFKTAISIMALCGALIIIKRTLFGQDPPPPIQFFIQDQNRWSCVLKGGNVNEGKLPSAIECAHSKTGEVVLYLPQQVKKPEQPKKEAKK